MDYSGNDGDSLGTFLHLKAQILTPFFTVEKNRVRKEKVTMILA